MPPSFCETAINLQKNNKFSEEIPHVRLGVSSPSKKKAFKIRIKTILLKSGEAATLIFMRKQTNHKLRLLSSEKEIETSESSPENADFQGNIEKS